MSARRAGGYGQDEKALTNEEKAGFALFAGEARCITCHPIGERFALFTDDAFHDTGIGFFSKELSSEEDAPVPVEIAPDVVVLVDRETVRAVGQPKQPDLGRFEITLHPDDKWRFKTPGLRNVAITAPYMHDGSLATLEDVVRFYDEGGIPHAGLDPLIQPLNLTDAEISALVAFLETLTSSDIHVLEADARSVAVGN